MVPERVEGPLHVLLRPALGAVPRRGRCLSPARVACVLATQVGLLCQTKDIFILNDTPCVIKSRSKRNIRKKNKNLRIKFSLLMQFLQPAYAKLLASFRIGKR